MATAAISRGWVKTADGWDHTEERMRQILFQLRAGRPMNAIADQFGCSISNVSHIRARAGIERRVKPRG